MSDIISPSRVEIDNDVYIGMEIKPGDKVWVSGRSIEPAYPAVVTRVGTAFREIGRANPNKTLYGKKVWFKFIDDDVEWNTTTGMLE